MEHHRPVFHSAVIFIAVGPLVGNICAWTYLVLTDPSGGGSDLAEFFTPLMFLLAMGSLAVAYIGGFVPAALSGASFGWFLQRYPLSYVSGAALGALLGFACTLALALAFAGFRASSVQSSIGIALLGACAGLVSACVVKRLAGSNNSFKPNPLRRFVE